MSQTDPFAAPEGKAKAGVWQPIDEDAENVEEGAKPEDTPDGADSAPESTEEASSPTGEPFETDAPEPENYEDLTVEQLKAVLEGRGLGKSGTKAELIARLTEDDANPEE